MGTDWVEAEVDGGRRVVLSCCSPCCWNCLKTKKYYTMLKIKGITQCYLSHTYMLYCSIVGTGRAGPGTDRRSRGLVLISRERRV